MGLLGNLFGSSKPKIPKPIDPAQSMGEYLFGKDFGNYNGVTDPELQRRLLDAESIFRPQYTALELSDIETMLLGNGNQRGMLDLFEEQSTRAGEFQRGQDRLQREADLETIEDFGPRSVQAYRDADPYSTELADLASDQAKTLYAEAEGRLSPERAMLAEQAARRSSVARGRELDNSSIAEELLGRERVRSQLREEARRAGIVGYNQSRGLYGDIGAQLLGRNTQSLGLGGQLLNNAQIGASGPVGPQLFDPNAGINLALQNQSNRLGYDSAIAQMESSELASILGLGGSLAGAAAIGFCWVAREVYGIHNIKWKLFRSWMLNDAPKWFRNLYIKYGERFARFISNKPLLKNIIRRWMDTKIA